MSENSLTGLRWIFILFLLFLWASPAWAVLYKWKDENGSTHFTDDITKVPPNTNPTTPTRNPEPKRKPENLKPVPTKTSNKGALHLDRETRTSRKWERRWAGEWNKAWSN